MSADGDSGVLQAEMDRIRVRILRRGAVGLAWATLGVAGAVVWSSAAYVGFGLSDAGIALIQIGVLLCTGVAVGGTFLALRRHLQQTSRLARWLDHADRRPEEVSFESAHELTRSRVPGESPSLVQRALGQAEARLRDSSERLNQRLQDPIRAAAVGSGASVAVALVCALAAPAAVGQGLSALFVVDRWDQAFERVLPEPRLSEFQITYRYPDYAGRAPRRMRSASGTVRALAGTEVTVRTQAAQPVKQAHLLLEGPGGADEAPAQAVSMSVEGRTLTGRFVVDQPGSYRIHLTDAEGEKRERRGHRVDLEVDEIPEVVLLSPDASPLDIDGQTPLDLAFRASDDFGLQSVQLRWRVLNRPSAESEGSLDLGVAPAGRRRWTRKKTVDLTPLKLQPGDRVSYYVEVTDNDRVHGPKVGASRTQELKVYSEREHHDEVLAVQMRALDELVHLLADHLEGGFDPTAYSASLVRAQNMLDRSQTATELLIEAEAASREDPLGRPQVAEAFRQAHQRLARERSRSGRAFRRAERAPQGASDAEDAGRGLSSAQSKMVVRLEEDSVYLADLLKDQRMLDAEETVRRLREQQRALRSALEDFRNEPTEEGKKQLAAQIAQIQQSIRELMAELASLRTDIPNEYVNREAMRAPDGQLQDVQSLLEQGDLQGAMERVDEMLEQTERMLSELQEGRNELQRREYSEVAQRAQEIWQELEDVTMRQRELARRTEEAAKEAQARMAERLKQADAFIEAQARRLAAAREKLQSESPEPPLPDAEAFDAAEERIADAERALKARDFGAAEDVLQRGAMRLDQLSEDVGRRARQAQRFQDFYAGAERLERQARTVDETKAEVEAVRRALEKLMPDPDSVLSPGERQQLKSMEQEQTALQQRTEGLQSKLQELSEQLPIVGEDVQESVQEAQRAMQAAGQSLGQGDAPNGLRRERRALESLERLKEQMQQMGGQGQPGGSGGVPMPFGSTPQGQGSGERDGQGQMHSQERVEIPQPEQYQAPAEFREDILEAAKEGTVESFEEAVRRYYEELVK